MPRLFFAIPLDEPCQNALGGVLQPLHAPLEGVRWLHPADRHLTLAFLGEVSEAHTQCLLQALPLHVEPFDIVLDALGRFPDARGRILAATGPAVPPLLALKSCVETVLGQCGVRYAEQGRPLRPHVTLARWGGGFRADVPALPLSIACRVDRAHLYVSEVVKGRRRYRVLG
jgi:2'-5' RNA ligase